MKNPHPQRLPIPFNLGNYNKKESIASTAALDEVDRPDLSGGRDDEYQGVGVALKQELHGLRGDNILRVVKEQGLIA